MWFTCNCSIIVSKLTHARLRSLFISSVMCRKISHIINLHAMMLTTFVGSRSSKVSICKSLPPGTAFRSYNSTVSAWFSVCYLILIFFISPVIWCLRPFTELKTPFAANYSYMYYYNYNNKNYSYKRTKNMQSKHIGDERAFSNFVECRLVDLRLTVSNWNEKNCRQTGSRPNGIRRTRTRPIQYTRVCETGLLR